MPTTYELNIRRPLKDLSDDLQEARSKQHETQAKLDLALGLIEKQAKQHLELLDYSKNLYQNNEFLKYQLEAADLTIAKLYKEGKRA
ncbi:hypothetical protein MOO46_07415 (plasmid) [Apilactobacillus apisilvae]|uniref:Uncharacterized protein n=1 Tax=Apilactobacillus apisilvae TaxID=2923364 RepID=A0ABY4PK43_9LACO|nr:hypothetical protein [Apilactobacillus apisilvae]UQS85813.1 hypothetical protein MOO46_07415 [Apilactobacillus apisilvae]